MVAISAIVCTYNRADLVVDAITSLCDQSLAPDQYEIIVVNNASTDHTDEAVTQVRDAYPAYTIRLIHEDEPGLSHARNAGWQAAEAAIVVYLDDDAKAPSHWLSTYLQYFETLKPQPVSVGGPVHPMYAHHKPTWFKDSYEIISLGETSRWLAQKEFLPGGNMAWQRAILEAFGGFETDKGVKGDMLALGEETYLYYRVWRERDTTQLFYYVPQLYIDHLVAQRKLTVRYQLLRAFSVGHLNAREAIRLKQMSWRHRLGNVRGKGWRTLVKIFKSVPQRLQYPTWQNWLMECYHIIFFDLGYICGLLGIDVQIRQR